MATEYTDILFIVVKPSLQQHAEDAAIAADPEAGAKTFDPGVPLRLAGDESNTVAAFWARWNMTPGQRGAFASNMAPGPVNIYSKGDTIQPFSSSRDRWMMWAVEAVGQNGFTPSEVLSILGLDRLAIPEGEPA